MFGYARLGLTVLPFFLLACSHTLTNDTSSLATPTSGPLVGAADSFDASDHNCRVVLWEVGRQSNGTGGYVDNGHEWIWYGSMDVSQQVLDQATPAVIYRVNGSGTWWEVEAKAVTGASDGFQRFRFQLERDLPGPGMSGTSISRTRIELLPLLHVQGSGRLFDHNRNSDEFANYLLESGNNWSISGGSGVCSASFYRPQATVSFTEDGQIERNGRLIAGGELEVQYDLSRLTTCRSTHNGYPAWDLRAQVQFEPSGQVMEATLREFESYYGTPTNSVHSVTAYFDIPADATVVEIWFYNHAITGGALCEAWDSNDGHNYRFDILPRPGWLGNVVANFSRAGGHPCEGGQPLEESFDYGTWPRTRAVMNNVCFEVWQDGVTDWENPDLWQDLDVRAYYRFGEGPFEYQYLDLVDQPGNNARYVFDVAALDPFRPYHCPDVPITTSEAPHGGNIETAVMEFFFTVNGQALSPTTEATQFRGEYWDYAPNWYREENCR